MGASYGSQRVSTRLEGQTKTTEVLSKESGFAIKNSKLHTSRMMLGDVL